MNPDSYTYSLRRRLRILFSPLRLGFFVAAVVFSVVANVIYINNGGGPEWLGLASIIPLWVCVGWQIMTDITMRRRDREAADDTGEGQPQGKGGTIPPPQSPGDCGQG